MSDTTMIRRVNGEDILIGEAEAKAIRAEQEESEHANLMASLRGERNAQLAASDWTQAADAPVDAKAWAEYRQALRDLPATIKNPTADVAWPEPPK